MPIYYASTTATGVLDLAGTDNELVSSAPSTTTLSGPNSADTAFGTNDQNWQWNVTAGDVADGSSSWSATLDIASFSGTVTLRFRLARYNSSGTLQSASAWSSNITTTGDHAITPTWDPGTWATSDRLVVEVDYYRSGGHGNVSATFNIGSAGTQVDAPAGTGNQNLTGTTFTKAPTFPTGAVTIPDPYGHLLLDGTDDYATTSDKAALDISGDLEVIGLIALDSYASGNGEWFLGKFGNNTNRAYAAGLATTGHFQLGLYDGSTTHFPTATNTVAAETGVAAGEHVWLRATVDVDNGASDADINFYWSTDPVDTAVGSVSWTAWTGNPKTLGSAITINTNTDPLEIGRFASSDSGLEGKIYGVWLYDGIGGTLVADPDYRTSDVTTDSSGNTWTKQGNATWVEGTASGALTGTTFTKAPTFPQGTVTGTVALTGTTFTKAPTFNAGAMGQFTPLTGSTFQLAPTFPQGTVDVGAVALAGSTYQQAPTFPAGTVASGQVDLTGTVFQRAPTFNVGTVTAGTVAVAGSTYQVAPSFGTGTVDVGPVALTGTVYQQAPTFPTGTVAAGAVDVDGALFQQAPTFPQGAVAAGAAALTGSTYQQAPTFQQGTVSLAGGTQPLTGSTFQLAPTFPQGTVAAGTVALSGAPFQQAPTFGTGTVDTAYAVTGSTYQQAPSFPQGAVDTGTVALAGSTYQLAPTFPQGAVSLAGAPQALTGTTYQQAPTFPQGTVGFDQPLTGTTYQQAPTFPQGAVGQGSGAQQDLTGSTFQLAPSFGTGTVAGTYTVAGSLFQQAPTFPQGAVGLGAVALAGSLYQLAPTFFGGAVSSAASGTWQEGPLAVAAQEGRVVAAVSDGSISHGGQE